MPHEEAALNEVLCCECGKAIPSIPAWLADARVKFECEECRSRHPRMGGPEPETRRAPFEETEETPPLEEPEDADDEADEPIEDAD